MITCAFEDGKPAALRHVVVHALVFSDNKLLMIKRAPRMIEGGKWGFPGGFVDRNETIEQAVIRELIEETGWKCSVEYLFRINSNPNRRNDAGRQNIAFEFVVTPLKKVGEMDSEQTEMRYFTFEEIEKIDNAFDHLATVRLFAKHQKKKMQLPLIV